MKIRVEIPEMSKDFCVFYYLNHFRLAQTKISFVVAAKIQLVPKLFFFTLYNIKNTDYLFQN